MKCEGCKFAEWRRTATGRLHPDKTGRCKRLDAFPLDMRLPSAFYWSSFGIPTPIGGYIERGSELPEDCAFKMAETP